MTNKIAAVVIGIIGIIICSCNSKNPKLGYETEYEYIEELPEIISADSDTVVGIENDEEYCHTQLTQTYANNRFSIRYPYNWKVVQQNTQATANTNIAVQIMQEAINDYDFRPNVNIIITKEKHSETTSSLAKISYNQTKEVGLSTTLIGIHDCQINGKKGSVVEYIAKIEGYKLHIYQYIVKKKDNTTFVITMTLDDNNLRNQTTLSQQIIDSIKIL